MGTARIAFAIGVGVCLAGAARAESPGGEAPDVYEKEEYTEKNTIEIGGGLGVSWESDETIVGVNPSIGWFVVDGFELSALLQLDYEYTKQDDGTRDHNLTTTFVIEPSYHLPLRKGLLYIFGGLGVGVEYDGDTPELAVLPRIGLNIQLGRSGIFTPALEVPILVGRNSGAMDENFGVDVGFTFAAGYTTFF